jgi:hypothetical protein
MLRPLHYPTPSTLARWLITLLICLAPALAAAQQTTDSGDASATAAEQAAVLVEEGTALFQARQYPEAAILFQQAYNLDPHPVLLFNIARAHQEMGDLPTAVSLFRDVVGMTDDATIVGAATERLQRLEAELTEQGYDPATVTPETYVPRGVVEISSEPAGADVLLGGESIGVTPIRQSRIARGSYDMRVILDGYHPINTTLEVRGGGETIRSFTLQPRTSLEEYVPPEPGYLTVLAPQANMEVFVDGQRFSVTPIDRAPLAPGSYEVVVSAIGWISYSTVVEIASGSNSTVQAQMTPVGGYQREVARSGGGASNALLISGGTLLTAGTVFGVLALTNSSSYNDNVADPSRTQYRDDARTQALIADIALFTGGALLVTGVVLRIVGGNDANELPETRTRQLVLGPTFPRERDGRWGFVAGARF